MANVGVSSVKLRDEDGDVVTVTSNRLDVNAYLSATPTIDIGDVSLLLGGTAASTNTGVVGAQTLRVTIASDTTGVLSVDDNGSTLSIDDGGGIITVDGTVTANLSATDTAVLDTIYTKCSAIETTNNAIQTAVETIDNAIKICGTSTYLEGNTSCALSGGVRNDALATLANTDNEIAPLQVNASGALYVDIADGGQLDALLDTIKGDTEAIETAVEILDNAISGSEMQVDVVAALPSGTNTIGSVTKTIAGTVDAMAQVSVGSSTTEILDALGDRLAVIIVNDSDEAIYLGLGSSAVMNRGIRLNANGGSFSTEMFQGGINGICASGSKNVTVTEISP